jgi:CheY-like chemotaxis protein
LPDQSTQHSDAARPVASILVIEDEEAVRGLFRAILEPVGYTIVEAIDGGDGLRRFRESPTDLVITDMYMPRGNALAVIRELRADYPTLKILAVYGSERPDESSEALRLGASAMLSKPLGVGELRTAVAQCLLNRTG